MENAKGMHAEHMGGRYAGRGDDARRNAKYNERADT